MKIGIITLHNTENAGQRLQNLALHTVLTQIGNDVETLQNYYEVDYDERALWPSIRTAWRMVHYAHWPVKHALADHFRRQAYRKFNEKRIPMCPWPLTNQMAEMKRPNQWNDRYDGFIIGSDQVWNPGFGGSTTQLHIAAFADPLKRLSYAAGICVSSEKDLVDYPWLVKGLKEMCYLSIRESASAKIVSHLTGQQVQVDIDPTLLLTAKEWNSLLSLPQKKEKKKYVFLYTLDKGSQPLRTWAAEIAARKGWELRDALDWKADWYKKGPGEWVRLIRDAQLVATDSFHATVFSLLMETPFACAKKAAANKMGMNERLNTLLEQAAVGDRTYNVLSEETLCNVNFQVAHQKFARLRQKSLQNLWNSLQPCRKECEQKPVLAPVQLCTGCAACNTSCTIHAISMRSDKEGFLFPTVDFEKCVKCGACTESCPICTPDPARKVPDTALAAWAKDEELRGQSSSGGVFGLLARETLRQGGCVFGAAMDQALTVRHKMAENETELTALQGSKYVQSEIGDAYRQAEMQLKAGRPVLFSGTPCQIAGLKRYLKRDYENLLSVQVICHGVPSPLAWQNYKEHIIKENTHETLQSSFRDKKTGWRNYSITIQSGENVLYTQNAREDQYIGAFLGHLDLRKSCGTCFAKAQNTQADIVLGDFWGIEKVFPQIKEDEGVSIVLTFTPKGETWLQKIRREMYFQKCSVAQALKSNPSFYVSSAPNQNRSLFFKNLGKTPFNALVERCLAENQAEWRKQQILKPIHWVTWSFLPGIKKKALSLLGK